MVQFNASSVPVLQLSLSSDRLNEQQLYDYGIYQMRQALAPIPGITLPTPYGGKYRQIMVDLDPDALRARGITPTDVLSAVNAQSLTLPSGDAKLGDQQFIVKVNATAPSIDALNRIPVKKVGGATVFLSDVAHVRDGWAVQQNIVRAEGKRSVLLTIIKNGNASTLDVVNRVKAALPEIEKAAPPGMDIKLMFDQSVFVQNAIDSVLHEGAIAAALTALMILIFLGSWRSTIVVMVSIPLSILTSIAVLSALGQTINTMTLGGLALAVGILVDDSTVTIENTHRLLEEGVDFDQAVLEGAAGIAVPTLISTLAICCVFVSVFFLQGAARYLFTPLAMAVVFAMIASYCISRTLTPIMIGLLIRKEHERHGEATDWLARFHDGFNARFDRFRGFYAWLLAGILRRKFLTPAVALAVVAGAGVLAFNVGSDFFPAVDAGLIQLHVRAPARTRVERTEQIFQDVEDKIRAVVPAKDLKLVLDNIGLPQRLYNLAFTDGSAIGVNDGVIQIELAEGHERTADIVKKLRSRIERRFSRRSVLFPARRSRHAGAEFRRADPDRRAAAGARSRKQQEARRSAAAENEQDSRPRRRAYPAGAERARTLLYGGSHARAAAWPQHAGRRQQSQHQPQLLRAGLAQFLDRPEKRHPLLHARADARISHRDEKSARQHAARQPRSIPNGTPIPTLLGNLATSKRLGVQSVFNHSNIQAVYDVYGSVQDRDLGGVAADLRKVVAEVEPQLTPGNHIVIRGQIESMQSAFGNLALGLIFAAVFVYMLMVINYQSFLDPLAVILALPGAGAGISAHAVRHRHHIERALADGRHHGCRRRLGELDPARHFRARTARGRHERLRRRSFGRRHAIAPCSHDRSRDDRRHDPDGDRRAGRRAECGAGPLRHRRRRGRHDDHPAVRAVPLFHHRPVRADRRQNA